MTPRYHQRGFHIQWQYRAGQNRPEAQPTQQKSKVVFSTAKTSRASVAKLILTNQSDEQIHQSSAPIIKWGVPIIFLQNNP